MAPLPEPSDIRRRILRRIEESRHAGAQRRRQTDDAESAYAQFLSAIAIPVFKTFVNVLRGEGHPFNLSTPEGMVRAVPEGHAQDFIELELDTSRTPPAVIGRSRFAFGRRVTAVEQSIREGAAVGELTGEDVLDFLVEALGPFVER